MKALLEQGGTARYANTGYGPSFAVLEVGLSDRVVVVEGDTGFWALVDRESLDEALSGGLVERFQEHVEPFREEMNRLRFGLMPSAVYFNPTERCNLNCDYCYLPEEMRRNGKSMDLPEMLDSLGQISRSLRSIHGEGFVPQLIFHGSEPMVARDRVFAAIEAFSDRFHFGLQTNATLLDDEAIAFLVRHGVSIGISLDAHEARLADRSRRNWNGRGAFDQVIRVMERLVEYPAFNVITTVTRHNVKAIAQMVDFFHDRGVRTVMFNPVRCTRSGGRDLKADDPVLAESLFRGLDRTRELYERTGRKLVVSNFANLLAGIVAPTGRRLMCDISPCGGGRCFVAVSARGDVYPCSEFIGFPEFRGGNLFVDRFDRILASRAFESVTGRRVEEIDPCGKCAVRHFCGAPCPAEVWALSGTVGAPSPYCRFYEELTRYAFRVIAAGHEEAYLWDGWYDETEESFRLS